MRNDMVLQQSPENKRPDLDTLPSLGALRRPGIHKRRMRHPPFPSDLLVAIETLQQQPLLVRHARPIIPRLPLAMLHPGRLPGPVGISVLDGDEVLVHDGSGVRERQREGLDGPVERTPYVDDTVAAAEERVGLGGGEVVADTGFGRAGGLVDVDASDGGAGSGGVSAADGVVEEEDAGCAGDVVEDEALDFGVVDFFDVCVVGEVFFGAGDVGEGFEGVVVEREGGFLAADVVDLDRGVRIAEVALWLVLRRLFDVVEGLGAVGWWRVELQLRCDWASRDVV